MIVNLVKGCGKPRELRHTVCTSVPPVTRRDGLRLKPPSAHVRAATEGRASLGPRLLPEKECCVAREIPFSICVISTLPCMCMTVVLLANTSPGIATNLPKVILLPHKQNSVFN